MSAMSIIYILGISILNVIVSWNGHSNSNYGDKDILLPFSSVVFLFNSLLIYLPEAHYTIGKFTQKHMNMSEEMGHNQQEQQFPISFFTVLGCIALASGIDALYKNYVSDSQTIQQNKLNKQQSYDEEFVNQTSILKYFMPFSLMLVNVSICYNLGTQPNSNLIGSEILIFGLFGILANFSFGYLLGWSGTNKQITIKLSIFTNFGILFGYVLGQILQLNIFVLLIPCIACGFFIYCCSFICLSKVFSNGQNNIQDRYRYGSIISALLLTIIYFPLCYLLRV